MNINEAYKAFSSVNIYYKEQLVGTTEPYNRPQVISELCKNGIIDKDYSLEDIRLDFVPVPL